MKTRILGLLMISALVLHINGMQTVSASIQNQQSSLRIPKKDHPIRFAYINRVAYWYGAEKIAGSLGVPGYADQNIYNYVALAFWGCSGNGQDVAMIWANANIYFGTDSPFGATKDAIQKFLRKKYNDGGVKVLVSAFGATEFPTSAGRDPIECANKLGDFVIQNNLDGADIDWEDNMAMQKGTGEQWLIDFTKRLRTLLPDHIITHAPQAPYFKSEYYKNGAYVTVHKQVGSEIDFYNVQFYNQVDSKYDTYDELFVAGHGTFSQTAVQEIIKRGIPSDKIVVGKPVTPTDASNTGWMEMNVLAESCKKAYDDFHWYAGVMFWQYISDPGGKAMTTVISYIKEKCAADNNCK